jgi:hypothetical protein
MTFWFTALSSTTKTFRPRYGAPVFCATFCDERGSGEGEGEEEEEEKDEFGEGVGQAEEEAEEEADEGVEG